MTLDSCFRKVRTVFVEQRFLQIIIVFDIECLLCIVLHCDRLVISTVILVIRVRVLCFSPLALLFAPFTNILSAVRHNEKD